MTESNGSSTKKEEMMTENEYRELSEFMLDILDINPKAPPAYVAPEQIHIKEINRKLSAQWSKLTSSSSRIDVYDLAITPPFKKCNECNFTYISDDTIYQHIASAHCSQ